MKEAVFHPKRIRQFAVDGLLMLGLVLALVVELPL
jgi:hypothetical protein